MQVRTILVLGVAAGLTVISPTKRAIGESKGW